MGIARYGSAVWLWTRSELRRRGLPLVLLGVLAGLAGGTAVAAFEGARVSGAAYDRARTELNAADAIVFPSQVGIYDFDPAVLDDMPEVVAWGGFSLNESQIDDLRDSPMACRPTSIGKTQPVS